MDMIPTTCKPDVYTRPRLPRGAKARQTKTKGNAKAVRRKLAPHSVPIRDTRAKAHRSSARSAVDPQALREHLRAALHAIEPDAGPELGDLLDAYEAQHLPTLQPSTQRVYRVYGRQLREAQVQGESLVALGVDALSAEDIAAACAGPGCSAPSNRARHVARVVAWGIRAGMWGGTNPAADLKAYKAPPAGDPFTEDELRRLLAELAKPEVGREWCRLAGIFLCLVPWRPGESMSLRVEDVHPNRDGARAYLRRTKNGDPQWRFLSPHALQVVKAASGQRRTGHVFRPEGMKLESARGALLETVHQACESAGLRLRRTHDLRHTGATNLSARGLPLADVSKALGHRSLVTTVRYLAANDARVRAGLVEFADALLGEVLQ